MGTLISPRISKTKVASSAANSIRYASIAQARSSYAYPLRIFRSPAWLAAGLHDKAKARNGDASCAPLLPEQPLLDLTSRRPVLIANFVSAIGFWGHRVIGA
jgi:hypothetical protein